MQRPKSSALYELAKQDRPQKVPVRWNPKLVQKIIHPTPHRSLAFFLLYDPSVTHIKDPFFRPSTIHNMSAGVPLTGSITSHIHAPPQLYKNSQNSVHALDSFASGGPTDNLTTCCAKEPVTEMGMPQIVDGERGTSCIAWYVRVARVKRKPEAGL